MEIKRKHKIAIVGVFLILAVGLFMFFAQESNKENIRIYDNSIENYKIEEEIDKIDSEDFISEETNIKPISITENSIIPSKDYSEDSIDRTYSSGVMGQLNQSEIYITECIDPNVTDEEFICYANLIGTGDLELNETLKMNYISCKDERSIGEIDCGAWKTKITDSEIEGSLKKQAMNIIYKAIGFPEENLTNVISNRIEINLTTP